MYSDDMGMGEYVISEDFENVKVKYFDPIKKNLNDTESIYPLNLKFINRKTRSWNKNADTTLEHAITTNISYMLNLLFAILIGDDQWSSTDEKKKLQ